MLAAAVTLIAVTFAATAAASPLAQFNRTTFKYTTGLSVSAEANRYQVMVLQATDASQIPALKAANPNLKILMYTDTLLSRPGDRTGFTTCTLYSSDNVSHPDWFLLDQNGNRIIDKSYPGDYVMDVGNAGYQQACAAHAIALAQQYSFDGVYLDDVSANVGWTFSAGISAPAYPTRASWQSAEYAFLSSIAPQIRSQGLLDVGNIGGSVIAPGTWQKWTSLLDGSGEEGFGEPGLRYFWAAQLANAVWSDANSKITILHTHDTTETGNTFGLATMMLAAQGHDTWSTSNANYTTDEAWYPEYDTAQALGAATASYVTMANGVYERPFAGGVVLVNPSGTAKTVGLGTGTYTGSGLTSVSTVNLGAWTGLILLADSPTAGTPANMTPPAITGTAALGMMQTASADTWAGTPVPTNAYQWSSCSTTSLSSCAPIPGATANTYTVQSADIGQYLEVTVTGTNSLGSATVQSAQSAQVPPPTFSLSPSATSLSVPHGSSVSLTVTVKPIDGFAGPVALSVSGLPSGATATFSSPSTTTSSKLTIKTPRTTPIGTSTLTLSGTGGGVTAVTKVGIAVK